MLLIFMNIREYIDDERMMIQITFDCNMANHKHFLYIAVLVQISLHGYITDILQCYNK